MGITVSFDDAVALLEEHNTIFIAAHIMPDGDCLGSALGLAWALRQLGKSVTVTCNDHVSNTFAYLPGFDELAAKVPSDEALIVFVDGSSADRFGAAFNPALFNDRPVLEIDHHITNDKFAPLNFIDTYAASTSEIILRLVQGLGVKLNRDIAQCLLTGIITDTLGFRTMNTTVDTLKAATQLMEAGGSIPEIVERAFNQVPMASLRLRGKIFSEAKLDGVILWAEVPLKTMREMGLNGNGTNGIINQLLSVDTAKVALLLIERDNGKIDVGLRSRVGYDVSAVAARLGGGGHKQAAGALLDGPLAIARERVLAEIRKSLENR
jgi:bifunctional oligoribonuclease and PAP phosphatase NrnA